MKRNHLIFITMMALALTLTLLLSGCAGGENDLEGNIVTFEINGGTLNYGTSSTDQSVNFIYHSGTYVKDPTTFPNYSISRNGYNFTGWYTSKDCRPNEKWDFTKTIDTSTLTLYAGWELAIKYTYSVNYMDGDNKVELGTYTVSAGEKFDDWRKFANKRDNYTGIGYFSDADCTEAWDFNTSHPGGAEDLDIPVYVKYIEGEWQLVDSYDKLKSAVKAGNVYLTADIDCGGQEFYVSGTFNKIFEGNGYKITNFTINKQGTTYNPSSAIFFELGENADIRNVSFNDVHFNFFGIADDPNVKANVAALAVRMKLGAKVSRVAVTGTFATDYDEDLTSQVNQVFYYKNEEDSAPLSSVTEFVANIIVDKQL